MTERTADDGEEAWHWQRNSGSHSEETPKAASGNPSCEDVATVRRLQLARPEAEEEMRWTRVTTYRVFVQSQERWTKIGGLRLIGESAIKLAESVRAAGLPIRIVRYNPSRGYDVGTTIWSANE